jgi:hypothetical protein
MTMNRQPERIDLFMTPAVPPKPRRIRPERKNTAAQTSYLLENIPRELLERAKTKARHLDPPVAVKWVLIQLLRQWVDGKRRVSVER